MWKWFIPILATSPVPAMGQDVSVDGSVVEACFQSARNGAVDPDCIGFAARLCQGREGETTVAIGQCVMAETKAWDALLNREYKETRDQFARIPALGDKLKAAQRGWIEMRDADCDIAYDRYEGGSMRSISAASCQMEHTARRALELRNMRQP
ncbi:lysozyme inhibitor LprI family protein [Paracoccus sp. MBLB3053]|uniref:Lysozyme inhibitor LprI family protein n=1 Tax=Paracoccus aurantius TaxID=3073814 RepID=A0ABU2HSQ8_9RHOB|nr:lysozyme inhibitor LprI family protein [Paracoccus sp. MBLB3053]MDS9467792.1 lysozyme inhibitor LprI family protein [Paracoccus sp. MBLB3053]